MWDWFYKVDKSGGNEGSEYRSTTITNYDSFSVNWVVDGSELANGMLTLVQMSLVDSCLIRFGLY